MEELKTFELAELRIAIKIFLKTGNKQDGLNNILQWKETMKENNPDYMKIIKLYQEIIK